MFNPRLSTPEGLVAVGGNLQLETLQMAYESGIFPWPQPEMPLLWFSPDPRGIIDFEDFHVPQSLKKFARKKKNWKFTFNQAFPQVIHEWRMQKRTGQAGTWILPEMEQAYLQLFNHGQILSLECWDQGNLIGGIYGVLILTRVGKPLFSGESMFHKKSNASKMCLWKLVEHLQAQGHEWMDIQMVTDVTQVMGGKYISREEYLQRIGV